MGRKQIGVVAAGADVWSLPYYLGASAAARDLGCDLITYVFPAWGEQPLDGVLTLFPEHPLFVERAVPLRARGVPIMGFVDGVPDASSVAPDNRQGIELAVGHLVGHGHRRIVFINEVSEGNLISEMPPRYQGYTDGLKKNGIRFDPELVLTHRGTLQQAGARQLVEDFLSRGIEFSAIVGVNDWAALGAIEALRSLGKRVPEDVAVIGLDNFDFRTRRSDPPLTTVSIPSYEVGYRALECLLEKIESGSTAMTHEPMPMHLLTRRSCGCRADAVKDYEPADRGEVGSLARELFARSHDVAPADFQDLANQFAEGVRAGREPLALIARLFRRAATCGLDPVYCHNFPISLGRNLQALQAGSGRAPTCPEVLREARRLSARLAAQYDVHRETLRTEFADAFKELREQVATLPDEVAIINCLRRCAARAGCRFFSLFLGSTTREAEVDAWEWRLQDGDTMRRRRVALADYETVPLLPQDGDRHSGVLFDLFHSEKHVMGHLVLDTETPYVCWYPDLVHYVNITLQSSRVHLALQKQTRELTVTRTLLDVAVNERKKALTQLEDARRQLQAAQN